MSHFIIRLASSCIFGTPNGQASTQLLQAMQRALRAVCTTPSSVRLMASAGQTSAQVGWSQCMQTTGTVCVETRAVDEVELDHRLPLVRVALRAGLDAGVAADAAGRVDVEVVRSAGTGIAGRSSAPTAKRCRRDGVKRGGLAHFFGRRCTQTRRAGLELGNLRDRILGGDRQAVDAAPARASGRGRRWCRAGWSRPPARCSVRRPRRVSAVAHIAVGDAESFSARRGWSSMNGSGSMSSNGPIRRVWVPERNWLTRRPVVRMSGYSSSISSVGGV